MKWWQKAFSRNGYDREAAVRELARTRDGSEVPYLLPRLNRLGRSEYARHFAQNLALLEQLRQGRRDDHRPLLDGIARPLLDPSPTVSVQARNALVRHAAMLDAERLTALLHDATSPHARRNVIAVIARLPKWESIIALLNARPDEPAAHFISRWLSAAAD